MEVFKVYSQDRIQQRFAASKPLTFQFRAVEVFKALAQDSCPAGSSSHSGAANEVGQGVFRIFSPGEKSAKIGTHSGSELSADS